MRKGFPEVIFGEGKSPEQIRSIAEALLARSDRVLDAIAWMASFVIRTVFRVYNPALNGAKPRKTSQADET